MDVPYWLGLSSSAITYLVCTVHLNFGSVHPCINSCRAVQLMRVMPSRFLELFRPLILTRVTFRAWFVVSILLDGPAGGVLVAHCLRLLGGLWLALTYAAFAMYL